MNAITTCSSGRSSRAPAVGVVDTGDLAGRGRVDLPRPAVVVDRPADRIEFRQLLMDDRARTRGVGRVGPGSVS